MGSHALEVARQGFWGSVTGGWFYDPHQGIFSNTLHLYIWLFLVCLPLGLHLAFHASPIAWGVYCLAVGILFVIIKTISCQMHLMFNKGEEAKTTSESEAAAEQNDEEKKEELASTSENPMSSWLGDAEEGKSAVELAELQAAKRASSSHESADTADSANSKDDDKETPSTSIQVEVHHHKGLSGSEDTICTKELKGGAAVKRKSGDPQEQQKLSETVEVKVKEGSSFEGIKIVVTDDITPQVVTTSFLEHPQSSEGNDMQWKELQPSSDSANKNERKGKKSKSKTSRSRQEAVVKINNESDSHRTQSNASDVSDPWVVKTKDSTLNSRDRTLTEISQSDTDGGSGRKKAKLQKRDLERLALEIIEGQPVPISESKKRDDRSSLKGIETEIKLGDPHSDLESFKRRKERHERRRRRRERERMREEEGRTVSKDSEKRKKPDSIKDDSLWHEIEQVIERKNQHKLSRTESANKSTSEMPTSSLVGGPATSSSSLECVQTKRPKKPPCSLKLKEISLPMQTFGYDSDTDISGPVLPSKWKSPERGVELEPCYRFPSPDNLQSVSSPDTNGDSSTTLTPSVVSPNRTISSSATSSEDSTLMSETSAFIESNQTSSSSSMGFHWLFNFDREPPGVTEVHLTDPTKTRERRRSGESRDSRASRSSRRDRAEEGAIPKRPRQPLPASSDDILELEPDRTMSLERTGSASRQLIAKMMRRMLPEETLRAQLEGAVNPNLRRRRSYVRATNLPRPVTRERNAEADFQRTRRRGFRRRNTSSQSGSTSTSPNTSNLTSLTRGEGRYLATNHDDTAPGSVHYFRDELGNWHTYTFGDDLPPEITAPTKPESDPPQDSTDFWQPDKKDDIWDETSSCHSDSTVITLPKRTPMEDLDFFYGPSSPNWDLPASILGDLQLESILGDYRRRLSSDEPTANGLRFSRSQTSRKPIVHNYRFWILPWRSIRVTFDRLAFLALFDRNVTMLESFFSVILAVLVSFLGFFILTKGFLFDFWMLWFCLVLASCQYSLIKSVQPDSASPMHGHNQVIAYSRPLYFCLFCGLVLLLDWCSTESHLYVTNFQIYGHAVESIQHVLVFARDVLLIFILFFPLVFLVGLLPQCNTFVMYLLETIDMYVFGGTASTGLGASMYAFCRSVITVLCLVGFTYGGLQDQELSSQHILFSAFCGLLVGVSYHLSRSASNPRTLWRILRDLIIGEQQNGPELEEGEICDPLPEKLKKSVSGRLQSDLIICPLMALIVFGIHASTIFKILQPVLTYVLCCLTVVVGFILHYVIPQLRKELPWSCFSHPILKSMEYYQFEPKTAAEITWFEKLAVWCEYLESNVLYPLVIISGVTTSAPRIAQDFNTLGGAFIVTICSLKLLRHSYTDTARQFPILAFTALLFTFDFPGPSDLQNNFFTEYFVLHYFFMSILLTKLYEWLLKLQFVFTYIAPWQITWGSAFHAFAQPLSVAHSGMLFVQTFISALFSTPLSPFMGSAIFLSSYVRPMKFWERDYNTKRVDHSNTRLSTQLEKNLDSDFNNLDSIFYEHLTRSLQESLCGDVMLGRWGTVFPGDCFILASDSLNALVHIIEIGNGLTTFQLRGLEFKGTYCQQREVEAITEGAEEDEGCCCCEPGHCPGMLSANAAFGQRWLAWQVTASKYMLLGYSITDNCAASMLQVFDLRKILITYYVKGIIYYAIRCPKLDQWIANETILEALATLTEKDYADCDVTFNPKIDEDYDSRVGGVSRETFCQCYLEWIQHCVSKRQEEMDSTAESPVVTLCFALCLLGRRALGTASHHLATSILESFLYGLHALFKGDFRITSSKDEWVFTDVEMLRRCVAPGVRMSLRLHQDHFTCPDEYDDHTTLYDAITAYEDSLVIAHEGDPSWRNAVLSNTQSLLALRHVLDEGTADYKVIMLNRKFLCFRVIKVNRECVKGLWAGQQQELVFLRNSNPERGSIQNAKQALRNMINSSCDQPIGYPIYVSPLTTSYADDSDQLRKVLGRSISFACIKQSVIQCWTRMLRRCAAGCSSGVGMANPADKEEADANVNAGNRQGSVASEGSNRASTQLQPPPATVSATGDNATFLQTPAHARGSQSSSSGSLRKGSGTRQAVELIAYSMATSVANTKEKYIGHRVKVKDTGLIFDKLNTVKSIEWPNDTMRHQGGQNAWKGWYPEEGTEGTVVHVWIPCHAERTKRSHLDKTILLLRTDNGKYVPVVETGITDLGAEV